MEPQRLTTKLIEKKPLLGEVFEFVFELPKNVNGKALSFTPGQYLKLEVEISIWRSYSIIEQINNQVKILVDLKIGGPASITLKSAKPGQFFDMVLPLGDFVLLENNRPKVFVTTGTGISPFLPMISNWKVSNKNKEKIDLFFGLRKPETNLIPYLSNINLESLNLYYCFSAHQPALNNNEFKGRVYDVLPEFKEKLVKSDVYIAGNPNMVIDTTSRLREIGVENIITERY